LSFSLVFVGSQHGLDELPYPVQCELLDRRIQNPAASGCGSGSSAIKGEIGAVSTTQVSVLKIR
jgi:hypothetical protein